MSSPNSQRAKTANSSGGESRADGIFTEAGVKPPPGAPDGERRIVAERPGDAQRDRPADRPGAPRAFRAMRLRRALKSFGCLRQSARIQERRASRNDPRRASVLLPAGSAAPSRL